MIKKKDLENKEAIEKDKKNFIIFMNENSQIGYNDIMDFMPYYQNLKPFEYNLMILKGFIK